MAQATQIKQQSAQLEAQSAQIKQQRTQLEAQSAPVSYTHLDVYKRQAPASVQSLPTVRNAFSPLLQKRFYTARNYKTSHRRTR